MAKLSRSARQIMRDLTQQATLGLSSSPIPIPVPVEIEETWLQLELSNFEGNLRHILSIVDWERNEAITPRAARVVGTAIAAIDWKNLSTGGAFTWLMLPSSLLAPHFISVQFNLHTLSQHTHTHTQQEVIACTHTPACLAALLLLQRFISNVPSEKPPPLSLSVYSYSKLASWFSYLGMSMVNNVYSTRSLQVSSQLQQQQQQQLQTAFWLSASMSLPLSYPSVAASVCLFAFGYIY